MLLCVLFLHISIFCFTYSVWPWPFHFIILLILDFLASSPDTLVVKGSDNEDHYEMPISRSQYCGQLKIRGLTIKQFVMWVTDLVEISACAGTVGTALMWQAEHTLVRYSNWGSHAESKSLPLPVCMCSYLHSRLPMSPSWGSWTLANDVCFVLIVCPVCSH